MIFISRKAFDSAVSDRLTEIQFKTRIDDTIWQQKNKIEDLDYRLRVIEEIVRGSKQCSQSCVAVPVKEGDTCPS